MRSGFGMGPAVLPANNLTLHVPGTASLCALDFITLDAVE